MSRLPFVSSGISFYAIIAHIARDRPGLTLRMPTKGIALLGIALAAVLTTFGVSGALSIWQSIPSTPQAEADGTFTRYRFVEYAQPGMVRRFSSVDPETGQFSFEHPLEPWSNLARKPEGRDELVVEDVRGWPFLCMRAVWIARTGSTYSDEELGARFKLEHGVAVDRRPLSLAPERDLRALPTDLILPAFGAAVVYWFAIWLITTCVLAALPALIRTRWRRRRGECTSCGYDMRLNSSALCPECGAMHGTLSPFVRPLTCKAASVALGSGIALNVAVGAHEFLLRNAPLGLHAAAVLGDHRTIERRLDAGEPIDSPMQTTIAKLAGGSPLMFVARYGRPETASLLISRGASTASRTSDWGYTPLHLASLYQRDAMVRVLLEGGADPNATASAWRITSLTIMPLQPDAHVEIAAMLLDAGADINANGDREITALHNAVIRNHPELVRLLIDRGANLDALTRSGYSAFAHAVVRGHLEIAQTLLDAGAAPQLRLPDGTPLMHVVGSPIKGEAIDLLLALGTQIEDRDPDGRTALLIAAMSNNHQLARGLLERGASLAVRDNYGDTVWTLSRWEEMRDLLREYGSEP